MTCDWDEACQQPATHNARVTYYTFHHLVCDEHAKDAEEDGCYVWPLERGESE